MAPNKYGAQKKKQVCLEKLLCCVDRLVLQTTVANSKSDLALRLSPSFQLCHGVQLQVDNKVSEILKSAWYIPKPCFSDSRVYPSNRMREVLLISFLKFDQTEHARVCVLVRFP